MFESEQFTPRYETVSETIAISETEVRSVFDTIANLAGVTEFSYSLVGADCFITTTPDVFNSVRGELPDSVQIETANMNKDGTISFRCDTARWLREQPYKKGADETTALFVAYAQEISVVDSASVIETESGSAAELSFTEPQSDTYHFETLRTEFQTTTVSIEATEDGITSITMSPLEVVSHETRDYIDWIVCQRHLGAALHESNYESNTIADGTIESVMFFEVSDSSIEDLPTEQVCGVSTTPIEYEQKSGFDLKVTEEYTEERSDSFVSFWSGYAFLPNDSQEAYLFREDDLEAHQYHVPIARPISIDGVEKEYTFGIVPLQPVESDLIDRSPVTLCLQAFTQ